jgi:glycosyltransferase involved in cell wall biosynthesis
MAAGDHDAHRPRVIVDRRAERRPVTGAAAPRLSVVMPVHNAAPYLDASVGSILAQTFTDFELVALDDGSTDASAGLLRDWVKRDSRVRLVESPIRLGLAGSADRVVQESRAPVCARMDADDVADPVRLEAQWEVLHTNPDVALVGTLWEGIDAAGRVVRPQDRWRLTRRSSFAPFPHGSIMFRREAFEAVGGYRAAFTYWEDLDFYLRMATWGRILVVPKPLYRYRFHQASSLGGSISPPEVRAVGLMIRCLAARRAGGDYSAAVEPDDRAGLDPMTLYFLAARRLWAGHAPGIRPYLSRVRRRRPIHIWLGLLVLATAGDLAPRAVRAALRALIRLRDARASRLISAEGPVEWRFE